jgi:hypothetical protein
MLTDLNEFKKSSTCSKAEDMVQKQRTDERTDERTDVW